MTVPAIPPSPCSGSSSSFSRSVVVFHPQSEPSPRSRSRSRSTVVLSHHAYHHDQPQPSTEPLGPPSPIDQDIAGAINQPTTELHEHDDEEAQQTILQHREALALVNSHTGLSNVTVEKLRSVHGYNETIETQASLFRLFFNKFWGPTPLMIIIAMVVAFALAHYIDGGVIAVLLLINAFIAFHEDVKARRSLAELVKKLQIRTRVQRDGNWFEIASRELVPGDLVRLRIGDIAGADLVVLNGDLSVDQSALTGESALKSRSRYGIVYAGAIIKRGEANAAVVATGSRTFFGETAKLVQSSKPNAHIDRILSRIVVVLMTLIITLVVISLIVMGIRGDNLADAVPLLLMVIVTALPVALPAMFTVSMALGSQQLSNKAVLVTRLNVLEDAAMMSILFSDKTGTLTQNHLTVQEVTPLYPQFSETDVLLTATLCSRKENSDPIDAAILEAYDKLIQQKNTTQHLYPSLHVEHYQLRHFVPFDASNRRTEAVLRFLPASTSAAHVVPAEFHVSKGAAATLCRLCGIAEDSDEWKRIDELCIAAASKGHRTIAVAYNNIAQQQPQEQRHPQHRGEDQALLSSATSNHIDVSTPPPFQLIGLLALFDPPRDDSCDVVRRLLDLGIQTKMLTGDAMGVACEIGDMLGLGRQFVNLEKQKQQLKKDALTIDINNQQPGTVTLEMETKPNTQDVHDHQTTTINDDIHMAQLLSKYDPLTISGFAQIFPSDKHYIVKHTQNRGLVCGMTGDGVNDAPALKQAEVGCAVSNATDVAKGSASALLLHDGLSGVVDMVHVGRQIHRRVEVWFINKVAKAAQQAVFILILFLILGRFPISALQVVLLLLLMDFVLVSLATDIQKPGRSPAVWKLAQLTRVGLVVGLLGAAEMMALILTAEWVWDFSTARSQTFAFQCMFCWGMFSVFSVREKSFFWTSKPSTILLAIVLTECLVVYIVCAVGVPEFEGLGWGYSSMVVGASILGCIFNDTVKTIYIRNFEKSFIN